jgi:hypothetical protein
MAIQKQAFYEGAALHLLARSGQLRSVCYADPFFMLNDALLAYLKYSTRVHSPWGFTFTADEQVMLEEKAEGHRLVLGLICGADGVASLNYDAFLRIAPKRNLAIRISCFRSHGEHYEVNGPGGKLSSKVAPSDWIRLLEE